MYYYWTGTNQNQSHKAKIVSTELVRVFSTKLAAEMYQRNA